MNEQTKNNFDYFVNTQLNPEQKTAVTAKDGSFLVIAGAGSGKTRVITARITNLIVSHGVPPSSIVALTFTNKAAQEMQHRIAQFLPDLRIKPNIATFHSYCLKLLKKYHHQQHLADFSVIDAQDAQKLLQTILKERGWEKLFNAKQLLSYFSMIKVNELLKIEIPLWNMHNADQFLSVYHVYQQQKRACNYLDFDDLLFHAFELFSTNEKFKELHLKNHRHILVDEYQDTNMIQHALLKQMTLVGQKLSVDSVCAVGDEDQSIYSWRGAHVANILDFSKDFADTKRIKLEQNYRSTQQILNVANRVIAHNTQRNHKQLWSAHQDQQKPLLLECLSDLQEASLITQLIRIIANKASKSSIAILYRTHYQSRIIEEALIKEAIAYKMIGGISFYERKEIKDLLAYLRLMHNPFDRLSFLRAINCPARGLGEKFEELFIDLWNRNPLSSWQEIAKIILEKDLLAKRQEQSLQKFLQFFNQNETNTSILSLLEHFVKETGYLTYLHESYEKIEAEEKRENVAEFLRAASHFDEQKQDADLAQFLDEIALMQELIKKDDQTTDRVNMMTLHSAKGLEFQTVILVGLEEGLLPSNQSIGQENVEEERRLFYVGITRAQKNLIIMHAKYRNVFGRLDEQRPSRFLREISPKDVIVQEASHWSRTSFTTFFTNWLENPSLGQGYDGLRPTGLKAQDLDSGLGNNKQRESVKTTEFVPEIKRLQAVKHATFGTGIAHGVEKKGEKIFVTVHFVHHGTKKIDSKFLAIV
jgi:DNA helicase-2/ATP-dependent DNA helicase PcrA